SGYGSSKTSPPATGLYGTKTTPATSTPAGAVQYAKPTTNLEAMKVKLDAPTLKLYSQALDAMDAKHNEKASALFKQVLDKFKGFEPAERNLKKLGAAGVWHTDRPLTYFDPPPPIPEGGGLLLLREAPFHRCRRPHAFLHPAG